MKNQFERVLIDEPIENASLLTTDSGKMYDLYILHPDGSAEVLEDDDIFNSWFDHCINPKTFKELAEKHQLTYTKNCYRHIVSNYNVNYLNIANVLDISLDGVQARISVQGDRYTISTPTGGIEHSFDSLNDINAFLDEHGCVLLPKQERVADGLYVDKGVNQTILFSSWHNNVADVYIVEAGKDGINLYIKKQVNLDDEAYLYAYACAEEDFPDGLNRIKVYGRDWLNTCREVFDEVLSYKTVKEALEELRAQYELDVYNAIEVY